MNLRQTVVTGTRTLALGTLLLAGTAIAFADHGGRGRMGDRMRSRHGEHHGPGSMWASDRLADTLDLDATQRAAAKQLADEFADQVEPMWMSVRDQHKDVRELLEAANPDATAIGRKMIAVHQAHQQIKALHSDFDAKFSALLNSEQREDFERMRERRKEFMEDGPHFGFRGDRR